MARNPWKVSRSPDVPCLRRSTPVTLIVEVVPLIPLEEYLIDGREQSSVLTRTLGQRAARKRVSAEQGVSFEARVLQASLDRVILEPQFS